MRKSLLYITLIVATLISSCSDDLGVNEQLQSDRVGFNVDLNNIAMSNSARSNDSIAQNNVQLKLLNEKLRGDSLFLFTIVEDSISSNIKGVKNNKCQSRGTEITTASIKDMGVTGIVYNGADYTDWSTTGSNAKVYMHDEQSTKTASWCTDRYWPETENTRMRFFAYSPYGSVTLPTTTVTPAFEYTIADKVVDQKDLLVASSDVQCPNNYEAAPLTFAHALTAVMFEIANTVEKITVKAVRVKDVYYKGKYQYEYCGINKDDGDDTTPNSDTGSWNVEETEDKKTYEINNLNKQIVGGTSTNIPLNENEYVLMLMPQTLPDGATIEVDVKDDVTGWEGTLKSSIAGNVWEKGKCVKYVISTSDIVVQYYFDILNSEEGEFPYYGGNGTLFVESYKTTTHVGGSLKENVSWAVSQTSGHIELDLNAGGESSYVDAISYKLGPAPIDESHTHRYFNGVTTLGTNEAPYDLSTEGGSESRNTANCYMVGAPGYYKIPLVIGNAILDGARNNNATGSPRFHGDVYFNYLGENWLLHPEVDKTRNGENIEIKEPYLVWQDAPGLVTDLRIVEGDDYNYLAFEVNQDYICDGNAVIAVKDTDGKIMWSWHIWVTHRMVRWTADKESSQYDPKEKTIHNKLYGKLKDGKLVDNNGNVLFDDPFMHNDETNITALEKAHGSYSFTLLSKYIGLCEAEVKQYGGTNVTIEIKQNDIDGQTKSIEINYADHSISTAFNACYYQWGRKDPMRPWGEFKNGTCENHKTCFGNNGAPLDDSYFYSDEPATDIATTIQNPAKFYGASLTATTWCSALSGNIDFSQCDYENLWQANNYSGDGTFPRGTAINELVSITSMVKTIYDPCPVGYEMPRSDAFTGFLLDNESDDKQVYGHPEEYQGYYYIDNGKYKFSMNFKTGEEIGDAESNNNGNILREPNPCAFVSGYQEYAYWFRPDVNGSGKWDGSFSVEENTDEQKEIYDQCLLLYALGAKGGSSTSKGSVKEFQHMGNALTATLVDKPGDGNNALPSRLYFFHDHNGWYPVDNTDCKGHTVPTNQTGWDSYTIERFYNYDGTLDGANQTTNQIITVAASAYNIGFTVLPAKTGYNGIKIE